jgi:hypothetical protein
MGAYIFSLGSFNENYRISTNNWDTFFMVTDMCIGIFDKNRLGYILGDFFKDAPATMYVYWANCSPNVSKFQFM